MTASLTNTTDNQYQVDMCSPVSSSWDMPQIPLVQQKASASSHTPFSQGPALHQEENSRPRTRQEPRVQQGVSKRTLGQNFYQSYRNFFLVCSEQRINQSVPRSLFLKVTKYNRFCFQMRPILYCRFFGSKLAFLTMIFWGEMPERKGGLVQSKKSAADFFLFWDFASFEKNCNINFPNLTQFRTFRGVRYV